MKILTLFISGFGVLFTSYIAASIFPYTDNLGDWLYFAIACTLLIMSFIGVLLSFEGIKIYRNRVRFM